MLKQHVGELEHIRHEKTKTRIQNDFSTIFLKIRISADSKADHKCTSTNVVPNTRYSCDENLHRLCMGIFSEKKKMTKIWFFMQLNYNVRIKDIEKFNLRIYEKKWFIIYNVLCSLCHIYYLTSLTTLIFRLLSFISNKHPNIIKFIIYLNSNVWRIYIKV